MNFRYILVVIALLILTAASIFSKEPDTKLITAVLDSSNSGTEFYFSFPPCYDGQSPGTSNCRVIIASTVQQNITLEIQSLKFKGTKMCKANDAIEFTMGAGAVQPYEKSGTAPAPPEKVYPGAAIHVSAQYPVTCYGVNLYNYSSEAFLALPVSSLGKEYIVSSYTSSVTTYNFTSETTISAAYDSTVVYFEMGGTATSETSGGVKSGKTTAPFVMNRGDVVCIATKAVNQDLSGSRITANKPVGVVSGNQFASVPVEDMSRSFIMEMETPVFAWGKEYHVTPLFGRQKNPLIRIYAKEKNTKVYRDGELWLNLPRSSRLLDNGYVERRSFDGPPKAVVITADKPIYVVMYNHGQGDDTASIDPFQLTLPPFEQYQKEVIWCTPGAVFGNYIKNHYINLSYQLAANDSIPDDFEYIISFIGTSTWKKVSERFGKAPGYLFSVNGQKYACKQIQLPYESTYLFRAKTPFGAYAYGFSPNGSYGMPISVGLNNLEIIDSLAPRPVWSLNCDGSVSDGTVSDFPSDSLKQSHLGFISMIKDSSSNYIFSYDSTKTFIAGKTKTTDWKLKVIDQRKPARAFLVFSDHSENDTTILVEYKGVDLRIEEGDTINLGVVKKGEKKIFSFTVATYGTQPITMSRLELKDNQQGFTINNTLQMPFTLTPPNAEYPLSGDFINTDDGVYHDQIAIGDSCLLFFETILKAEIASPDIKVDDFDYGAKTAGTKTTSQQLQIRNRGKVDLVLTGDDHLIAFAGTPFEANSWVANYPITIKPFQYITFNVDFAPQNAGDFSTKVTFSSDAKRADSVAELKGSALPVGVAEGGANSQSIHCKLTPQPIRENAVLELSMPTSQRLTITVINMLGQKVATIAENAMLESGVHTFPISTTGYSSGNYSIEIRPTVGETVIQKMTVVR